MTESVIGAIGSSFVTDSPKNWEAFLTILAFLKSGSIQVFQREKEIEIRNDLTANSDTALEEFFLALLQLDIYDIRMVKRSKNCYRVSVN